MNEFTKEELHLLLAWSLNRCEAISGVKFCREGSGQLFDKIQALISNYKEPCEHELNGEIELFVDVCSKCNDRILRNE